MSVDLSGLSGQVLEYLGDPDGLRYSAGALEAGIRLALGEYNLLQAALGLPQASLAGLDGAEATSLPAGREGMIVEGAAGYAAARREAALAEVCTLEGGAADALARWSGQRLEAFRQMLAEVGAEAEARRLAGLRQAAEDVLSAGGWPLDAAEVPA